MRSREVPGVEGDGVDSPFAEDLVHVRSNSCPSKTGDAFNYSVSLVREERVDGERTSYVLEPPKLAHEGPALFEGPLRALDDSGGVTLAPVKGCVCRSKVPE